MASLDLGFDDAGDGIARQSLQSSTPNSPAQPHHIIDFSSSSAQQTPPESSNLHDTPMGGAAGHMIDFGDYKRPPTSHRTIRVAASVDTTADIDSSLLAELPSVQKMQRHVRPTTANAMKARRASRARAQAFQRTRKSQVRPMMQNDLDMDEPSRLQNRYYPASCSPYLDNRVCQRQRACPAFRTATHLVRRQSVVAPAAH